MPLSSFRASRGPHSLRDNPNTLAEPISTSPSCPPSCQTHLFSIFSCSSSLLPTQTRTDLQLPPPSNRGTQSITLMCPSAPTVTSLPSDRPLEMSAPSGDFPTFLGSWFSYLSKHLHICLLVVICSVVVSRNCLPS